MVLYRRSVHVKQRPGLMDGILSLVLPQEAGIPFEAYRIVG